MFFKEKKQFTEPHMHSSCIDGNRKENSKQAPSNTANEQITFVNHTERLEAHLAPPALPVRAERDKLQDS